jgi:hypothetical protein
MSYNELCSLGVIFGFIFGSLAVLAGLGGFAETKAREWLLCILFGFSLLFGAGYLLKSEKNWTVDSGRFEQFQREVRLHYPELRQDIHKSAQMNEFYGLTVGQIEGYKREMQRIDANKLNGDE